jgi:hypothetical protein
MFGREYDRVQWFIKKSVRSFCCSFSGKGEDVQKVWLSLSASLKRLRDLGISLSKESLVCKEDEEEEENNKKVEAESFPRLPRGITMSSLSCQSGQFALFHQSY